MTISSQVLVITGAVIEFSIKITHSVQVSNVTNSVIDFLGFTTISSIIITHLDNILRITMTISNPMVIWTTVLAIIATFFTKVDEVTLAIVNQEVGFTIWSRFTKK